MVTLFLHRLLEALRRRHERRATLEALYALNDRELDDIGIARGDIRRLVQQSRRAGPESPPVGVQARRRGGDTAVVPCTRPCEKPTPSKPVRRDVTGGAPARY